MTKFYRGENIKFVNLPETSYPKVGSTGTFLGYVDLEEYVAIIVQDDPAGKVITMPVGCIRPAGPKSWVNDDMIRDSLAVLEKLPEADLEKKIRAMLTVVLFRLYTGDRYPYLTHQEKENDQKED